MASSYGDGADRIFLDSPKCDFAFRVTHRADCLKMRSAMIYAIVFYCRKSQTELDTYRTSFHSVSNLLEAFLKAPICQKVRILLAVHFGDIARQPRPQFTR